VKLDANENPYGPPPQVTEALANLEHVELYPDPDSNALRAALATFTGVPADLILAGAGSDELLALLTRLFLQPGDAVLNCPPTFGMYDFFAAVAGARNVTVPRKSDFSLDLDAVEEAAERENPKLLFVASPNNPDGGWLPDAHLERLLALPLLVVLDEAYVEFASGDSRIARVPEEENLVVLRTFSKWAGLAGLRVGYGAFPAPLLPHLRKIKEPYTVSAAAHAAALAVLATPDYLPAHRARVVAERERAARLLEALPFIHVYPSEANFLFCRVEGRDAGGVKEALAREGILVRHFSPPDLEPYLRIAVGTPQQTDALVAALEGIS
jgi:histidinol-phosphate aminotransferase